jgi:PAS domain S-box-containing protein
MISAASHSWDPGFSSRALSTLIDKLSDGVVLTDSQGMIILWNAATVDITGIPVAAALDGFLWDVLHTLTPEATRSPQALDQQQSSLAARLLDQSEMRTITEMRLIRRADGASRTVQFSHFTLAADGANHIACTLRDVTSDVALDIHPGY